MEATNGKISTLIVDDEQDAREVLSYIIDRFCPDLELVGTAEGAAKAEELILTHRPQLLLLDINIKSTSQGKDIFDLLARIPNYGFEIIFVTAYNQYALQAIKCHAFDYLLKPVNVKELVAAVAKLKEKLFQENPAERLSSLARSQTEPETNPTIWVPVSRGYKQIEVDRIHWIKAVEHFTEVATEEEVTFASKSFGELREVLTQPYFFQVHRSYLVNLKKIKEVLVKGDSSIIMTDGAQIPIARNRKSGFLEFIEKT